MSFEVKNDQFNGKPCYVFVGQIDEEAIFPEISEMGTEVVIDLGKVTSINSVGIRSWIMWFGNFADTKFTFMNCPKALVMQMNMVEGFLPAKCEVISLEVPFFCEECDKEIDVLFHVGKEIIVEGEQVKLNYDKSKICPDGCDPELDVSETKFFRFLLDKIGDQAA